MICDDADGDLVTEVGPVLTGPGTSMYDSDVLSRLPTVGVSRSTTV